MECGLEDSVVDWVLEHPAALMVFEQFGIDATCAGKSLEYVCRQAGIDPAVVLAELRRVVGAV
ncbi:DUF542 domain-containing protein [Planctellipticum variicoloris]|uniref:DUF542 domain-containing protein n=1 Tax=Planctellipticum variicoloris TaxID=3064265 RepID=UPI003013ADEC|nr:DUF542 domain-containing protein [Planctomycetaceae bacterium SH412]